MNLDCLIIDDEKMLADNTCEYFSFGLMKCRFDIPAPEYIFSPVFDKNVLSPEVASE